MKSVNLESEKEKIKSLLEQGMTRKEIAKLYGISKNTLARELERMGFEVIDKDYYEREFWKKIENLKEKNKGLYDYSLITRAYSSIESVPIKCLKHGNVFHQILGSHSKGFIGCVHCRRDKDRDEFVKKAKKKYGDRYDYSNVVFKGNKAKVEIKCNQCGNVFYQTTVGHLLSKEGCPKCALRTEARLKRRKVNWDDPEVIKEFERLIVQERKPFLEIGEIFGISGHQVGIKAREFGIKKPPHLNIPKEEEDKIRELAKSCESVIEISRIMGVPRFYVQTRMDFLGIQIEKEDSILDKDLLLENLDYNTTIPELAEKLGVSNFRIMNSFWKHGLDIVKCKLEIEIKKFVNPILYLKRTGFSVSKISKILEISFRRVNFLLEKGKELGLEDNSIKFNKEVCLDIFKTYLPKTILEGSIERLEMYYKSRSLKLSSGEALVLKFLEENELKFKSQVVLRGIIKGRNIEKVIIDFILTYNDKPYWIEYNGFQHYNKISYFKNDLDLQIQRDNNVKAYCKENGIGLIEVPYTLDTFEKVSDFLTKVLFEGVDQETLIDYNKLYEG